MEHRLLELLNLIELKEHDLLEYKSESFRKLIEYHQEKCPERIHAVMKLMRTLVKSDYDLAATYQSEKDNLQLIMKAGVGSQLMSLIDVLGWIEDKVNPRNFRLVG
jgi:aminopeptidase-like protein